MKVNGLSEKQKNDLTSIMQRKMESGTANGAALCILQDGVELYRQNFGFADKEAGIPIKNDSIYRLFSMTKPVISVAVHICIERGLVNYEDPITKYFPSFKGQGVLSSQKYSVPDHEPTIQEFLNMTAGLSYSDSDEIGQCYAHAEYTINKASESPDAFSTTEVANLLGTLPLAFEPGSHWRYSTCADVLGAVVEVVSGVTLGQFLKKEIFEPLEMTDTGFYLSEEKLSRYTVMYDWPNEEHAALWPHEVSIFCLKPREFKNKFESGGAGLVSTVDDYAHFVQMLLDGGEYKGRRILQSDTIKTMFTPSISEEAKKDLTWESLKGYTYTNLFRILENPDAAGFPGIPGTFGWDGWTGNYFFGDPENNITFLYFVQLCGGEDMNLIRELANVIYTEK